MKTSLLTLGTAQLGMSYGVANVAGMPDDARAKSIVDAAFAAGVTSFDTAPAYGIAEQRLGALLDARAATSTMSATITTKVASQRDFASPVSTSDDRSALQRSVEASVRRSLASLRVARVQHVLLHDAHDLARHGVAVVDALVRLVDLGLAESVGVSTYGPDDVRAFLAHPRLRSIQIPLNLLDQRLRVTGLLDQLAARDVTVFARSAYLQGLFALDRSQLPARVAHCKPALDALDDLCARFSVRAIDVALAWAASQPAVTSVVVGADDAAQIEESARRATSKVPAGLDDALRATFASIDVSVVDPSLWRSA